MQTIKDSAPGYLTKIKRRASRDHGLGRVSDDDFDKVRQAILNLERVLDTVQIQEAPNVRSNGH